jgi:hypothetical protein
MVEALPHNDYPTLVGVITKKTQIKRTAYVSTALVGVFTNKTRMNIPSL